jgi:hypothetical protein
MSALIALAAVSTAYSMYSQSKSAAAKVKAAQAQAEAKRRQALSLFERSEINIEELKGERTKFLASQVVSASAAGRGDMPLALMEDTWDTVNKEINFQRMEAKSKIDALMAGADIDTQLAGDIKKAGQRQQIATLLGGGTSVAMAAK